MHCDEFESNASLYLYGELPAELQFAFESHQSECPACRKKLEKCQKLHGLLSQQASVEVSPDTLLECRRALESAIERELEKVTWRSLLRGFLDSISASPAPRTAGILTFLVLGFGVGWTLRPLVNSGRGAFPTSSPPALNAADLSSFHINGIRQVQPDPTTGGVKITLDAERRLTLEGSLDNPQIRDILIDAVKGYQNAGIRHDTLDALRQAGDDPAVESALLYALKHDPNTGLRLEALESIGGLKWNSEIERGVIEAVRHDGNPGVRVEAVDLLTRRATPAVLPVLNQLASKDPNPYVRLRCTAAVRQLAGNDD